MAKPPVASHLPSSSARPSKRPRLDNGCVDSPPLRICTDDEAARKDSASTSRTGSELCHKCSDLDLEHYFRKECKVASAGYVKDFNDPTCPFCALVSKAISLHWMQGCRDSEKLPKRLYLRSKSWWYHTGERGRRTHHPRLLLAVNAFPPGYSLGRPILDVDLESKRFVLAELESLPSLGLANRDFSLDLPALHLRRDLRPRVDTKLISQWIQDCRNHCHSNVTQEAGSNHLFQHENGFRLIDVIENCLAQQQTACEYVALSYVWGKHSSSSLKCTRGNVSQLSRKQALTDENLAAVDEKRIPATIKDAIQLVRTIGIRYLWVDSLCILQDDEDEKKRLIHGMNFVYENATVTIIACAGRDAAAGLPGIRSRNNNVSDEPISIDGPQKSFSIAIARSPLVEQVRKSRWNTRGWTYQEQCLSKRCLYFTPHEVFFVCKEHQWREGYSFEQLGSRDGIRHGPPFWHSSRSDHDSSPYLCLADQQESRKMDHYFAAVSAYTRRSLSFSSDILNAFSGIFKKFSSSVGILTAQGIPTQYFPEALLWYPEKGCERLPSHPNDENHSSWSWSCFQGPVSFVHSAFPFRPAYCFDLEYIFSSEFYYAICSPDGKDETGSSTCWEKVVISDEASNRKTFMENEINVKRPQEAERGPPAGLSPSVGELCFWAPVLRPSSGIRSYSTFDLSWPSRSESTYRSGHTSDNFLFDDDSQTLRQSSRLIPLGTAIEFVDPSKVSSVTEYAEYVRCVQVLCVEMQDDCYIRNGIGVMYMFKKLCREDYWDWLAGELFGDYEWQFVRLR